MDATASLARGAAVATARGALDAELVLAEVEDHFALTLRACARGGCATLETFCAAMESSGIDEAPAVALVEAMTDPEAAERAVRAVTWTMVAQRVASAWPMTFYEVLDVARVSMPLDTASFEYMQMLGALTACANTTEEPDVRDGQRMQFCRESLEHVIAAATGRRPARRDMLMVIPPWTSCFTRGIKVCEEYLREPEQGCRDVPAA